MNKKITIRPAKQAPKTQIHTHHKHISVKHQLKKK